VLEGVVAFGGAVPEEEAMIEGWRSGLEVLCMLKREHSRKDVGKSLQLASSHIWRMW